MQTFHEAIELLHEAASETDARTLAELKRGGGVKTCHGTSARDMLVQQDRLVRVGRNTFCRVPPKYSTYGLSEEAAKLTRTRREQLIETAMQELHAATPTDHAVAPLTLAKKYGVDAWIMGEVRERLVSAHQWIEVGRDVRRRAAGEYPRLTWRMFKEMLRVEDDAGRQQVEDEHRLPVEQRVEMGVCVPQLQVLEKTASVATLLAPTNLSKFKTGDTLRLFRSDPSVHLQVRLKRVASSRLIVEPGFRAPRFGAELSGDGWIADRRHVSLSERLGHGVEDTLAGRRDQLMRWLNGERRTHPTNVEVPTHRADLNDAQRHALALALVSDGPALIQGPPGTGKTWLLARLAVQLAKEGHQLLVTSFTHRGVNNALAHIHRAMSELGCVAPIAKFGQPDRAHELPNELSRLAKKSDLASFIPKGPCIVGMTTHSATITLKPHHGRAFWDANWVLMDEASQVSLPLGLGALSRGERAVLFGDHKQMAPVLLAKHGVPGLERSIFEALWDVTPGVMLRETYRLNRQLVQAPSREYYEGRLESARSAADREYPHFTAVTRRLGSEDTDLLLVHNDGPTGDANPMEAKHVVGMANLLISEGLDPAELVIVAPFRLQVRAIQRELETYGLHDVLVDTVERIQGQEREAVLISLVVPMDSPMALQLSARRLCVSTTRARSLRAVVADRSWTNHSLFAATETLETDAVNRISRHPWADAGRPRGS